MDFPETILTEGRVSNHLPSAAMLRPNRVFDAPSGARSF